MDGGGTTPAVAVAVAALLLLVAVVVIAVVVGVLTVELGELMRDTLCCCRNENDSNVSN